MVRIYFLFFRIEVKRKGLADISASPFCRCSRFMTFGSTFLIWLFYIFLSESAYVLRTFQNTVYAVCPYAFNRTFLYLILYSVVCSVFPPSILQTLFFPLPFQRVLELRATMLLRASRSHNPVCPSCSFSFSPFPVVMYSLRYNSSFPSIIQLSIQ